MIKKAFWGFKWTFIQQFFTQLINLGSLVYLSHLIEPDIHGFFAIAIIGVTLTSILGSIGLNELIIKDKSENFKSKSEYYFGIIILLSIIFIIVTSIFGLIISYSYSTTFEFGLLLKYSLILGLIAPMTPFRSYLEAVKSKELDFKKLSFVQITTILMGVIPSIFLAKLGHAYEALASRYILPHLFYIVFGYTYFKVPLKAKFSKSHFKTLKNFSLYYSLNNIVNYFVRNLDYMIIGKFFSPAILGQYVIAYKILLFPLKNITSKFVQVGMPLLTRVFDNKKEFKDKYFLMIESIAFVTIPIMLFISLKGKIISSILFSKDYPLLGDMIVYLAIVGAIQSVISPVGMLFYFKEQMKLMFKTSLLSFILIFFSFYISSLYYDIFLVLKVYAVIYTLLIFPNSILFIYKKYNFKINDFYKSVIYYTLSVLISLLIEKNISTLFSFDSQIISIVISFVIFSFLYLSILLLFYKVTNKPKLLKILIDKFSSYVWFRGSI